MGHENITTWCQALRDQSHRPLCALHRSSSTRYRVFPLVGESHVEFLPSVLSFGDHDAVADPPGLASLLRHLSSENLVRVLCVRSFAHSAYEVVTDHACSCCLGLLGVVNELHATFATLLELALSSAACQHLERIDVEEYVQGIFQGHFQGPPTVSYSTFYMYLRTSSVGKLLKTSVTTSLMVSYLSLDDEIQTVELSGNVGCLLRSLGHSELGRRHLGISQEGHGHVLVDAQVALLLTNGVRMLI